jgi:O-antigen/teichoic acid export membrane protein
MGNLKKNSIYYLIANFLTKAIHFFLLPVYTHFLDLEQYGILGIINSIIGFLSILYSFSMGNSVYIFYHMYRDDEQRVRSIWSASFTFVFCISVFFSIILFIFRGPVSAAVTPEIPFYPYFSLALISVTFAPIYALYQAILRTEQKGRIFAVNAIGFFIINTGGAMFFLSVIKMKAEGVLLATAIANFLFFLLSGVKYYKTIRRSFEVSHLKETIVYALPLIPHALASWTLALADRLLLNRMVDSSAVGLYNFAYQISNVLGIITLSINQAFGPWFLMKLSDESRGKSQIRSVSYRLIALYSLLAIGISWFAPPVLELLIRDIYFPAFHLIPILTFSFAIHGIYYIIVGPLFLKRNYLVAVVTILGGFINVLGNIFLIPMIGTAGAAISSLVATTIYTVVAFIFSKSIEDLGLNVIELFGVIILGMLLYYGIELFSAYLWIKIICYLLFFLAIQFRYRIVSVDTIRGLLSKGKSTTQGKK